MTGYITWNQNDINTFLMTGPGLPGNLKQNFFLTTSAVDRFYPFRTLKWTNENVSAYGIGVMQVRSPNFPNLQNVNQLFVTSANYFNLDFWQSVIQPALQIQNIGDASQYPLASDGLFRNTCLNGNCDTWSGRVSLTDYVLDLLAPLSSSDAGSTPQTINNGNFNPDRLFARSETSSALPLPMQQYLNGGKILEVFPVIPPMGYVTIGQFYSSNFATGNTSDSGSYNYSPTSLLFLKKDDRFAQPPLNLTLWPTITFPSSMTVLTGSAYSTTVSEFNLDLTAKQPMTYIYSPLGNLVFSSSSSLPTSQYPAHFPWSVNLQLFRFFPNGPTGTTNTFANNNKNRLIFPNLNGQGGSPPCSSTPQGKIVNPLYHSSYVYPSCGGSPLNLAFAPVSSSSQTTVFPVLVPMGLYNLLTCCTGQFSSFDLTWTWSAFPPFPIGVTDMSLPLAAAICRAGNYSFAYSPKPATDCDLLTQNYCNPAQGNNSQYGGPNCACQNATLMLINAGLPVPPDPSDSSLVSLEQTLTSNIGCYYVPCSSITEALKLSGQRPQINDPCPDQVNCVITGVTISGSSQAQLENNCTGNGNPTRLAHLNITIQVLLFLAAGLFVVVAIVILLLRRKNRRKEKLEQESDHASSSFDPADADEEDDDQDFQSTFSSRKYKSKKD
jgi:hypothetical protein